MRLHRAARSLLLLAPLTGGCMPGQLLHRPVLLVSEAACCESPLLPFGVLPASAAAEGSNAENRVVTEKPVLARAYLAEFLKHSSHSAPHGAPAGASSDRR